MPTNDFIAQLGLEYPILQAPIGSMAGVELAAAVSNARGLGCERINDIPTVRELLPILWPVPA